MIVLRVIKEMFQVFLRMPVIRSAAALSYYLTLSVFPFLICISAILGLMNIQETETFGLLSGVIPEAAFSALTGYLEYVSGAGSQLMFTIGLTAMLTSSSAAFRSFTGIMGDIQGKMRFSGIWGWIISFMFSIVLLAAIYGSALVTLSGEWIIQFFETNFYVSGLATLWRWIRYVFLFMLLFTIIYSTYFISAPKNTSKKSHLPGAFAATIILVAASAIYSQLITVSIRYEILYGSLASFIILMIWLHTCSLILISANIVNISINKQKEVTDSEGLPETISDGKAV